MTGLIFLFLSLVSQPALGEALVDPLLKSFSGETARVIILPVAHSEGLIRPRRYSRPDVVRYFKEVARQSLTPLIDSIGQGRLNGVTLRKLYWVNSSVAADVTYEGLKALAKDPDVYKIYADRGARDDGFLSGPRVQPSHLEGGEARYDFETTGIDRVHHEFGRINGNGVIVGVEDSGVVASHPALQGRVAVFFSGRTHKIATPEDYDDYHGHGTHVCGTIAGTQNDIGVAPGVKLAVAGTVLDGEGNFPFDEQLEGMQWFVDAEKSGAVANQVKVINNSWMSQGAPDLELFYRALAAWEASGILPVFSAGNGGDNGARSITNPHEYPGTFTVANYQSDGRIAEDSSVGPATYHGQDIQKPEIAAPGTNITSAGSDGGYREMSGTSMAAPHVTGVVAMLVQINPAFNPQQLRALLLESADSGPSLAHGQWDAHWGFGKLNAYNAVKLAIQMSQSGGNPSAGNINLSELMNWQTPQSSFFARYFHQATLGEVGGDVDQFRDTDPSRWLRAADL